MATSLRTVWSSFFWMRSVATCKQAPLQNGAMYHACQKSTYSVLPEDYNCKVELAVTSDLKTIVCYHPSLEIPYEHTKMYKPLGSDVLLQGSDHLKAFLAVMIITTNKFLNRNEYFCMGRTEAHDSAVNCEDEASNNDDSNANFRPIPRPDPVNNKEETHDQVLKSRLNEEELKNKRGPTMEELSKMFYTTKHRWYPVGQYHRRRRNPNPPKDR